jgi:hypothetical protein
MLSQGGHTVLFSRQTAGRQADRQAEKRTWMAGRAGRQAEKRTWMAGQAPIYPLVRGGSLTPVPTQKTHFQDPEPLFHEDRTLDFKGRLIYRRQGSNFIMNLQ